ncbi:DUF742 domain-containing protein, partial [Streptomyces sp. SID11233]|uniref:DUF742 domain-containing protein n=1 Tax=Streptomyces sp. SID11385 TaxID=2706031 RepID=UPI0013C28A7C|nr:DUF742 domain-containing protein [Streptomyces sp. SID11385]NEA42027.1 DUF742 domain-containing protein [Streptomyces sp. SID11385]NED89836.1 DUF742 domain-containing protein [Streptomyces sp. SID11233]
MSAPAALRPYVITRGRARATYGIALEALLTTRQAPRPLTLNPEERTLLDLCARPTALAEAAARLALPLGLTRVLASDLVVQGLLTVSESVPPEVRLLRDVLAGLRRMT